MSTLALIGRNLSISYSEKNCFSARMTNWTSLGTHLCKRMNRWSHDWLNAIKNNEIGKSPTIAISILEKSWPFSPTVRACFIFILHKQGQNSHNECFVSFPKVICLTLILFFFANVSIHNEAHNSCFSFLFHRMKTIPSKFLQNVFPQHRVFELY